MGKSDMAHKEATCANHKSQPRMLHVVAVNNGSMSSVSLTW